MKIEVLGHSGCSVEVLREERDLFIIKSTRDASYLSRLAAQAAKQRAAEETCRNPNIRVPKIYAVDRRRDSVTVKMEYIYSKNFIEYFESAGFNQILRFTETLTEFISGEAAASAIRRIDRRTLLNKFADVDARCRANAALPAATVRLLERCAEIFGRTDDLELPVGPCHGDLTFSNILFSGDSCYLIDFLDSFIESPLMDIVKIRQDSAFMWSALMYTGSYDSVRLKIISDRIDRRIDSYCARYEWYRRHYGTMQLMNFLRILQYAREPRVTEYLHTIIKRLTDEF